MSINSNPNTIGLIKQRLEILYQMVENLEAGGGSTPVDAYTKSQTDALLADKADKSTTYTKTQTNNEIDGAIAALDVSSTSATGHYIKSIEQVDGKINAVAELVDTTPTTGSTKLCTSGGIYDAIQAAAGGGGTDLTPVYVGAKSEYFPEDYMYVLQKHLPYTASQGGDGMIYLGTTSSEYFYARITFEPTGSWGADPTVKDMRYTYDIINKNSRKWTSVTNTGGAFITGVNTFNLYPLMYGKSEDTKINILSSSADLNNSYNDAGFYKGNGTSMTNCPTTEDFLMIVDKRAGITQRIQTTSGTPAMFFRTKQGQTWTNWYQINTTVVS